MADKIKELLLFLRCSRVVGVYDELSSCRPTTGFGNGAGMGGRQ